MKKLYFPIVIAALFFLSPSCSKEDLQPSYVIRSTGWINGHLQEFPAGSGSWQMTFYHLPGLPAAEPGFRTFVFLRIPARCDCALLLPAEYMFQESVYSIRPAEPPFTYSVNMMPVNEQVVKLKEEEFAELHFRYFFVPENLYRNLSTDWTDYQQVQDAAATFRE